MGCSVSISLPLVVALVLLLAIILLALALVLLPCSCIESHVFRGKHDGQRTLVSYIALLLAFALPLYISS